MLLYRVQGAVLALLGAGSLTEAWRITQEARESANFDAIGPDRYLLGLGVLMIAIGAWMALRPPAPVEPAAADTHAISGTAFGFTVLLLAALTAALPYVGFTIGSFGFLTIMFQRFGRWSWVRSTAAAGLVAAIFYVAFIYVADVPLPRGYLL